MWSLALLEVVPFQSCWTYPDLRFRELKHTGLEIGCFSTAWGCCWECNDACLPQACRRQLMPLCWQLVLLLNFSDMEQYVLGYRNVWIFKMMVLSPDIISSARQVNCTIIGLGWFAFGCFLPRSTAVNTLWKVLQSKQSFCRPQALFWNRKVSNPISLWQNTLV